MRRWLAQLADDFWCLLGLHRWNEPGGHCENCGDPDRFPGFYDDDFLD